MAAIIEPRLHPTSSRPALRVVPGGPASAVPARAVSIGPTSVGPAPVTGRQVVTVLLAVVVALGVVVGAVAIGRGALAGLAPAGPSGVAAAASGPTATVRVEVGDTMWSIARDLRPSGDVRPLVDELVRLNGSATIVPGQELVVPAG